MSPRSLLRLTAATAPILLVAAQARAEIVLSQPFNTTAVGGLFNSNASVNPIGTVDDTANGGGIWRGDLIDSLTSETYGNPGGALRIRSRTVSGTPVGGVVNGDIGLSINSGTVVISMELNRATRGGIIGGRATENLTNLAGDATGMLFGVIWEHNYVYDINPAGYYGSNFVAVPNSNPNWDTLTFTLDFTTHTYSVDIGETDTLWTNLPMNTTSGNDFLKYLYLEAIPVQGSNTYYDNIVVDVLDPGVGSWKNNASGDWNLASNWLGTLPNNSGVTAKFGGAILSPQTVYTNTAVTVNGLEFDNANRYVLTGAGSLTLEINTGTVAVNVLQGSHKINLPLIIASDTDITIAGGAALVIGNPMTVQANRIVSYSGDLQIQAPLSLEAGASMVAMGGTLGVFGAPAMSTGAEIDLKASSMVVDYSGQASPASMILGQLTSGYNNGAWDGEGINTSSATAATGLGWAENSSNSTITVRYTYYGDVNLSGTVDSTDFNALVAGYGLTSGGIWADGDFNYDGKVDTQDFNYLAGNFNATPLPAAALGAVVPEPGVLGIALFAVGLIRRRSR